MIHKVTPDLPLPRSLTLLSLLHGRVLSFHVAGHLALLHPSEVMGRIVLDKARTASYVPYTRGAQDVIETMFATQVHPLAVSALLFPYPSASQDSFASL